MNENMSRLAITARQDHSTSAGAASLVIGAAMEVICKTGSVFCTRLKLRYSEIVSDKLHGVYALSCYLVTLCIQTTPVCIDKQRGPTYLRRNTIYNN
jgi:hypothetical protein